jgi:hypothetical protein
MFVPVSRSLEDDCAFWLNVLLEVPPKSYQETPCDTHDADSSMTFASTTKFSVKPYCDVTVWLVSNPAPCHLNQEGADLGIARLVDALLPVRRAAVGWCPGQTGQGSDLSAVVEFSPCEYFHHEGPRAHLSGAFQLSEFAHLVYPLVFGVPKRLISLPSQELDLILDEDQSLILPLEALP